MWFFLPVALKSKNNGTLTISDGNTEVFSANKAFYKKTTDTIPQEGKTYYTYNKDTGVYTLWVKEESTNFPEGAEVYEVARKTTFSGALEGASGSFSGELKGATGVFSGELRGAKGIFSGELQGATGVFTGSITAQSGTIGGFEISSDKLSSIKKGDDEKSYIVLDGTNGKITAENIELGNGAGVKDKISFKGTDGTVAYLQNPTLHDGIVLNAGDIKLRTNGILEFGDIKIFGDKTNPTIKSSLWTIDKDKAVFNNVIAQGGTIENVVFKNSTVQGAGGIMFFKPSYSGTYDGKTFFIEEKQEVAVGDHVVVNGQEGDVTATEEVEAGTKLTISNVKFEKNQTVTIIKLYNNSLVDGKINLTDNLLIGVNSLRAEESQEEVVGKNEDCHLFRGGLTVTLPTVITKTLDTGETQTIVEYPSKPSLFIGDLHPITGKPGYGLYGDNVYLNGTLTTKVKGDNSPTYAGVNTIDGCTVGGSLFTHEDKSQRIVFWAGSTSEDAGAIQNAPFQVTDKGNLYAKAGTFTDSIFSNSRIEGSEIRGADIYTARIHGWKTEGKEGTNGELSIYNTSNGIVFREEPTETNANGKELFSIKETGLKTSERNFITIGQSIVFSGDNFEINRTSSRISLSENKLSYLSLSPEGDTIGDTSIKFSNEDFAIDITNSNKFLVEGSKITSKEIFLAQKNVLFGNSLEYRKVTEEKSEVGYDLYIKTSTQTSELGQGELGTLVLG